MTCPNHIPDGEPGCAGCYDSLHVDYAVSEEKVEDLTAEVQERRAELVKVYKEGADAIAQMVRRDERLRFVLVETIKLTASPLPFALTMEIGALLGVPELRTTSGPPPEKT